jgi:hypothetical protein
MVLFHEIEKGANWKIMVDIKTELFLTRFPNNSQYMFLISSGYVCNEGRKINAAYEDY